MKNLRFYLIGELEILAELLESNGFGWVAEDVRLELKNRGY